jgi:tryptophan synthase alpha chain
MANRVMAHLVASYPDEAESLEVARALAGAGAAYLELQFPFSEPTADGPVIQNACARALESGFSVAGGLRLLEAIRRAADVPVFVMTYGNMAYRSGMESFTRRAAAAGACGLIIPDLSPGADEGLYAAGAGAGLEVVPVVVPTMSGARLAAVLAAQPAYVYAALRAGITGTATDVGGDTLGFLRLLSGPKVLAGFGIQHKRHADILAPHVHAVVVGSVLVAAIQRAIADGGSPHSAAGEALRAIV